MLLLIRHGQTDSNLKHRYMGSSDEDINKEGRAQVETLSFRLKSFPIKTIYSSPLKRALTTAEILSHGKKISIRSELTEINFGDWEGLTKEEVREKWPSLFEKMRQDPGSITPPNGESFAAMQKRVHHMFTEMARLHPNETIAIITHDIIIKALVIHALQAPTSIYHHFQISPASLTILKFDGKAPLLTLLNSQTEKNV